VNGQRCRAATAWTAVSQPAIDRGLAAHTTRGPAVAIDPTGQRKDALDAFLEMKRREGFEVETRTETHAIVVEPRSVLHRLRVTSRPRLVLSVDEAGVVTMTPAEAKRT